MNNTSFKIAGFFQPYYVMELLHQDDHDGFMKSITQIYKLNYPMIYHYFKDVFLRVIELHDSLKTYTFGEEAKESFIEYHDTLNERKRLTIDNDMRGVLSKAKGQSARLAMILHVADHCIKTASSQLDNNNQLPSEVGKDSMERSTIIMNHLINVKYILRPPATPGESAVSNSTNGIAFTANGRNIENDKIRKNLTHSETSLSPSFMSRKSWCLPVNGKYPVQSAIQILKKLKDLGLGCLREISHPHNNKRSKLTLSEESDNHF